MLDDPGLDAFKFQVGLLDGKLGFAVITATVSLSASSSVESARKSSLSELMGPRRVGIVSAITVLAASDDLLLELSRKRDSKRDLEKATASPWHLHDLPQSQ